jgi:CheY-like chemotaxis protein
MVLRRLSGAGTDRIGWCETKKPEEGAMFKILIVENPGARELLAQELAFDGHTVITTADGETAKEVAAIGKPDLVILDPFLRGKYRWDLLATMKQENPFLPVLIVTDYATNLKDPHVARADGYLNKESSIPDGYAAEIKRKVRHILKEPRLRPAAAKRGSGYRFSANGSERNDSGSPLGPFH